MIPYKPQLGIGIWSEDYKELAAWYEEVLELNAIDRQEHPDDSYVAFEIGDNFFSIGHHSEVHGKSRDPYRIMIHLQVPSVTEAYEVLKDKEIDFIATPFEAPLGGYWCMTLHDPEGNIIQFFGDQ